MDYGIRPFSGEYTLPSSHTGVWRSAMHNSFTDVSCVLALCCVV